MTPCSNMADLIHGATEIEFTARGLLPHRLPQWVRDQFPDPQLAMVERQPSGVRLTFATAARRLELQLHSTRNTYRGAHRPRGVVEVRVDGASVVSDPLTGGDRWESDLQGGGGTELINGPSHTLHVELSGADSTVEIWLPHNESIELLSLSSDLPIRPLTAPTGPRWLHHGSSISQGSAATTPTGTWPAVAAGLAGVDLYNLSFSGSAVVDPFMARVIRDSPADLISLKLGINVVNLDAMRLRSFVPAVHGFLDTIRDGHPETPLLLISPIHCAMVETTPGPSSVDPSTLGTERLRFVASGDPAEVAAGRLSLQAIRRALRDIHDQRRGSDPYLYHLAGTQLYSEADELALPMRDNLHPDSEAQRVIGTRFAELAWGHSGPFAR